VAVWSSWNEKTVPRLWRFAAAPPVNGVDEGPTVNVELLSPSAEIVAFVSGGGGGVGLRALNVAITVWSAFIVSAQLPAPLHPAPDQPANADPAAGEALSVTPEPSSNGPEHPAVDARRR
jgi:hypothetical protein